MKKYVLIAGVNGAGKSTLYQSMPKLREMPRVNLDDIVKEFGDWKNLSDMIQAGKISVSLINRYFADNLSFNQETTLCGKSVFKNLQRARELGYYIELHYVSVNTVEIAKERVKERVKRGGHGIPEKDIERRYRDTFQNLRDILPTCDLTIFYDNSELFHRFAIFRKGTLVRLSRNVPEWFNREFDQSLFL